MYTIFFSDVEMLCEN